MHLIDQSIVFTYFFINILIGLFFALKRKHSPEEFISANNSMPGWLLGLSIVATYFSSIGFLAITAESYRSNWAVLAYDISFILILILAVKYFIPFHRKNKEVSSFTHLGKRFGPWATVYALCLHTLTATVRMGIMLFLVSKTLAFATGWNEANIILIVGLVTTLYTCGGGLKSVIWTDALQFLIMLAGTFFILFFLISNTTDGLSGFFSVASEYNKFSLGDFSLNFSTPTFWVFLIAGFFMNLYDFGISPPYVQRYIAASSSQEAKKSMIWSTITYCGFIGIFILIGTALFTYYHTNPQLLPDFISPSDGDSVYTYFIANGLPIGLKGLMIAAILAAAMSSVDSTVNSLSMLYLVNVHRPFINPHPGQKTSMRLLYLSSLLIGLTAICIALLVRNQKSILETWFTLSSLFTGGALGLFLIGLIAHKAKKPAAVAGILAGTLVVLWTFFSPYFTGSWASFANPFHKFMTLTLVNITVLIVGLAWNKYYSSKRSA